jgi:hypothetical protein
MKAFYHIDGAPFDLALYLTMFLDQASLKMRIGLLSLFETIAISDFTVH